MTQLGIPADSIERAIAFGDSQAGRYLRNFLYDGFNADEEDRIVFDGMLVTHRRECAGQLQSSFRATIARNRCEL